MLLEARPIQPQRLAVIGGGISGLAAAYLLAPHHAVTLFEAAPQLGGHARTVMAGLNGDQPVDTGFIVFNYANYPHLTRMFQDLDVPVTKSDMSFGASINGGQIE
jgi:predicted NAD/FAD-binding protein